MQGYYLLNGTPFSQGDAMIVRFHGTYFDL